uniref:uncharacterized protein LOC124054095 n=1 Tax=Scatophagus argus TaxID=75038 RepID=UPI001ED7EF43|nr:uncharacterized protein LOC124054095 [Scatophagus argus]
MALLEAEKMRWRAVLTRLTAIVQSLAVRNLALRGHTETLYTPSNGNFLKEVELMAKFDPIMKEHLNRVQKSTSGGHTSYLSHRIQNELVDLLSSKIISEMVSDIKKAKYFSLILDCTPDISHTEQLSVVIRVVSLTEPCIKEHFMGFLEAEESTGLHLAYLILKKLEEFKVPFEDCRGQAYDNGANMMGKNKASTQRWVILKKHVDITLKMWTDTRWESKVKSVEPLRYEATAVREALIEVIDHTKDPIIKVEAQSLSEEVGSYRFSICTVVWYDILSQTHHVSKLMQSPSIQVDVAVSLLKKIEEGLQSYRAKGFVTAQMSAKAICEEMNVESVLQQKRLRSTKHHFSYEASDEPLSDALEKLEVTFFNVVVDAATSAIQERFSTLENVREKFGVLSNFQNLSDNELQKECETLQTTLRFKGHSDVDGRELVQELKNLPVLPSKSMTLLELLTFIHEKELTEIYPNLLTALRIGLTLPVTVAEAERSFSKLKLIKTYLRSTMSQERLAGLAIISINHTIAQQISYDDVIDDFASKKARKVKF